MLSHQRKADCELSSFSELYIFHIMLKTLFYFSQVHLILITSFFLTWSPPIQTPFRDLNSREPLGNTNTLHLLLANLSYPSREVMTSFWRSIPHASKILILCSIKHLITLNGFHTFLISWCCILGSYSCCGGWYINRDF